MVPVCEVVAVEENRRELERASAEVTLVQQTLAEIFVAEPIERLIGDNAYDWERLDRDLAETEVGAVCLDARLADLRLQAHLKQHRMRSWSRMNVGEGKGADMITDRARNVQ